jgi:hypothetical protein
MSIFERWYFGLVLKLEIISYNGVIIMSWRILILILFLGGLFWRLYFCMVKYLSFS